jgi:hypothetical protein
VVHFNKSHYLLAVTTACDILKKTAGRRTTMERPMKKILLMIYAALIILGLAAAGAARAQSYPPESGDYLLAPEELDELLAPIALYPDPLLAQILPAATFVDQIDEAARFVSQFGPAGIDDQPWDVSVKAVAHYPDILYMMDQKYDWTASLGQAFINQEQDVMDAIQRLRAEAEEAGNLSSTPQQEVVEEDDYIRIVPANPDVIYVPQYDPLVIYEEPSPAFGFITFSIGFTIGAWLDRDCDWHGHRVFYHGWQGGGWIGRARPHIHDRRNIYINNKNNVISVNRMVMRSNTADYRNQLRLNARRRPVRTPAQDLRPKGIRPGGSTGARREAPRRVTGAPPPISAIRPPAGAVRPSPVVTPPATGMTRPAAQPNITNFYRGRAVQGSQPAARTGYGGYGSGSEATKYRQRGEKSLESMGRFNRQQPKPAQIPRPATPQLPSAIRPAPRPAAPMAPVAPHPAPPAGRGGAGQMHHR